METLYLSPEEQYTSEMIIANMTSNDDAEIEYPTDEEEPSLRNQDLGDEPTLPGEADYE